MRLKDLYEDELDGDMGDDLGNEDDFGIGQDKAIDAAIDTDQDDVDDDQLNDDIWNKVSTLPFVTKYDHDVDSPYYPQTLTNKTRDDLISLKAQAQREKSEKEIEQPHGRWDEPDFVYYTDLVSFIDRIMMVLKSKSDTESDHEMSPDRIRAENKIKNKSKR